MGRNNLHPTAEDTVTHIVDNYEEAVDYRVSGDHLLVKISVENDEAEHYREITTATPGMKRIQASEHFTYDTSQFEGRDSSGRWQYTVKFNIHDYGY